MDDEDTMARILLEEMIRKLNFDEPTREAMVRICLEIPNGRQGPINLGIVSSRAAVRGVHSMPESFLREVAAAHCENCARNLFTEYFAATRSVNN